MKRNARINYIVHFSKSLLNPLTYFHLLEPKFFLLYIALLFEKYHGKYLYKFNISSNFPFTYKNNYIISHEFCFSYMIRGLAFKIIKLQAFYYKENQINLRAFPHIYRKHRGFRHYNNNKKKKKKYKFIL